jgi:iron(III) transport system ATP-binding protein
MNKLLDIQGLEIWRGQQAVLKGLDLAIGPGEQVLLVGRSGSGKSSLLRAIAGLLQPRAGQISIAGRLVTDGPRLLVPPERRGIGYLFQGGALWPHLGVRATLEFVLAGQGLSRSERAQRLGQVLEEVELKGFDQRLPRSLSGGEAQRLALARALVVRPQLLLLDEPLGPLDAELRRSLLERLESLRAAHGFAALHVTHDPGEAQRSATRILRLADGRLQPVASPVGSAQ